MFNYKDLLQIMKSCEQTKGMSVYEHGISVKNYLFDLIDHLRLDTKLKYEWKLPSWVYDHREFILDNLLDDNTLELYTTMHDCGKPFCLTIDQDGRRHFPNHTEVSYKVFKEHFKNKDAAELIRRDMYFHLLKAKDLEEFSKSKYAVTLMLTALAEIHSNSTMFGGVDSISFKIKWKHTNKKGKQVLNLLTKNN